MISNFSQIYDISMTIESGMQVYKNKEEKKPEIINMANFSNAKVHETRVAMDVHCGTHLDAALHMIEGGETIEAIPLEELIGTARVIDLTHVKEAIEREHLESLDLQKGEWVVFKTRNSLSEEFDFDFVYLADSGAQYCIERGVQGVGTDGLGIERAQPEYPTHRSLLRNRVHIVEGLRLKDVPAGTYTLVVAPLKLTGIDAAPARAFLMK